MRLTGRPNLWRHPIDKQLDSREIDVRSRRYQQYQH